MKAIIFDLDNTLFHSTLLVRKARLKACKAMIETGFPEKDIKQLYKTLSKIVDKKGSNYSGHFDELCKYYNVKNSEKFVDKEYSMRYIKLFV